MKSLQKLLYIALFFFGLSASAQSIKVTGMIADSIGKPLGLANIIAKNKTTGEVASFAISDHKGMYKISLKKGNTYTLRASFLGYKPQEKTIKVTADSKDMNLDFVLTQVGNQLEGVKLVYEMPVTIKGDTIVYNADSFTNGTERKLGDVLKKLPGMEVNDQGEVKFEGKTVSKVKVEGKDFFEGDTKLATKNIPADAVDKVQVLRNYNDVSQMKGLGNDSDNVAINIKLKEGKKKFWFGEITGGVGIASKFESENGRYLAHPKLFYYSPKYSINIITDFNNVGEVPFTFMDYFKFTGGFKNLGKGGTRFNVDNNALAFAMMQNNRAKNIETNFFAGNFSYTLTPKWDVNGFAILSDGSTDIVSNSTRQYLLTGLTQKTESSSDQRNRLGMFKLSSTYKPNHNFQLDYNILAKTAKQTEDDNTLSTVHQNTNAIAERKENQPFSLKQSVNAYYTLNEKNIFSAKLLQTYQNENPFYRAIQDSIPFRGIFTQIDPSDPGNSAADTFDPLKPADRYNINQDKWVKTNKIDGRIDYYYILNHLSNLNFTLGATYSHQNFNSGIFQILDGGSRNDFEAGQFNNDVSFDFTDLLLGLHYKLKAGKFLLIPGLTLHNYTLKNIQMGSSSSQNDWRLLPDLNVTFNIKKSESIRFNYALTAEYSDVNKYAAAYVFDNYNRLFRGNRELENAFSHSYRLSYFNFNIFNYTNIFGMLSYTRRVDAIKTNTLLEGINRVSTPENFDHNYPDETFMAMGQFSKRFKDLKFTVGANLSLNKMNSSITLGSLDSEIQKGIRESQSLTQNYKVSLSSSFENFPNFELGYSFTMNDYDNAGAEQTFYTHQPYLKLDVRFLKDFEWTAKWDFYDYTNDEKTVKNRYSFVDSNLYYQKAGSPWEFSVRAVNILNTKSLHNDSFSDEYNITRRYFVMPRIVMFVVKYEL